MNFEKRLTLALESVIDKPRSTLAPDVWAKNGEQYTLRPEVSNAIYYGISKFNTITAPSKILIIGGISTYNYTEASDIDVNVEVPEATDQDLRAIYVLVQSLNGQFTFGTHPLNWWASTKLDQTRYDSAYDVVNDRWINGPNRINLDLYRYIDEFEAAIAKIDISKTNLIHDIYSLDILKDLDGGSRNQIGELASQKLREINREVDKVQHLHDKVIGDRREAFANPEPTKLREYKTKSAMPENIIYLLLKKYYYLDFLKKLDDIAQPLDMKDINRVYNIATGAL